MTAAESPLSPSRCQTQILYTPALATTPRLDGSLEGASRSIYPVRVVGIDPAPVTRHAAGPSRQPRLQRTFSASQATLDVSLTDNCYQNATLRKGICNPNPISAADNNTTFSYGTCIRTPEGAFPKERFPFTPCRGLICPCFSYENDNLHPLSRKSDSLYNPRTARAVPHPCRPRRQVHV